MNGEIIAMVRGSLIHDLNYYQAKVDAKRKAQPLFDRLAEMLDKEFKLGEVAFYGQNFTFTPSNSEKSTQIVVKLLDLFPEIERFAKVFDGASSIPRWNWVGEFDREGISVTFTVKMATPNDNCLPRQEVHTYKTWVCGKE